ncbi:matrix metalloproteinase-2-like [Mizuhopecten yessoensis]|uniref:Matrix metalloproteinase-16 n=1 Tax=Mizuhopecten yessoensis TaxID=6573 RepID=A0A210PXF2_MIZYE|nr:matrix metalloproteinase-2-like [Mizuhopecten yessoensis]XP_021372788.1 matrix metalloproteinase-2-like [Mizuhopecten yessoensis]OWF41146.1 Matrix metalloproteinase-16 [Mizuhopecten yessoensis]
MAARGEPDAQLDPPGSLAAPTVQGLPRGWSPTRTREEGCDMTPLQCRSHRQFCVYLWCIVLFLTILECSANSYRENEATAVSYLKRYGYLKGANTEMTQNLMSQEDLTDAIKRLQRKGNLSPTGIVDQRTIALMSRKRCGVPDEDESTDDYGRRRKRYVLSHSSWKKKDLTYRILNYTPDMPMKQTRRAIYEGFQVWSDVTNLTFTEVPNGVADIMIKFAHKFHQDGYPFDGQGLILAHAFYPGEEKGGDTHFDDDEHWTYNSEEEGVDLFMVAAHEFGHALGLGHSNEPGALMYPWYQGYQANFRLPQDDVIGIQALYGARPRLPPSKDRPTQRPPERVTPRIPRPRPTPRPRNPVTPRPPYNGDSIDPCSTPFDAIAVLRGELFLFIGEYFWRQTDQGLIGREKISLHSFWMGMPHEVDHIDAVFERLNDQKIIFFIGDRYWVYNSNSPVARFPPEGRPITEFGIPPDVKKIDAAFVWSYNSRTYLISGDMYWKLNTENNHIEMDYPRDMSIWRDVPVPVSTAFQYKTGPKDKSRTYFFKDDKFYLFYDDKMRVKQGYPKSIRDDWWGCKRRVAAISKYGDPEKYNGNTAHSATTGLLTTVICVCLAFIGR